MTKLGETSHALSATSRMTVGFAHTLISNLLSGVVMGIIAYYTLVGQIKDERETRIKDMSQLSTTLMTDVERRFVSREVSEARYDAAARITNQSIEYLRRDIDEIRRLVTADKTPK